MSFPVFASGDVLNASDMNAVGLWLVKTQSVGSGVTSVTVTSAFSADYDNYRIVYAGGVGSTNITLSLKLGASATGYYSIVNYAAYGTSTTPASAGDNNATQWTYAGYATTGYTQVSLDLLGPFTTKHTVMNGASWAGGTVAGMGSGVHQVSTSYSDFTIGVNTGNLTGGTIRVYGYRN
jgi:hypothetical protein